MIGPCADEAVVSEKLTNAWVRRADGIPLGLCLSWDAMYSALYHILDYRNLVSGLTIEIQPTCLQ